MRGAMVGARAGLVLVVGLLGGLSGCELAEITIAEPDDIMVVEAYVRIGDGIDQVSAWVHWTMGTRSPEDLTDLTMRVVREDGEDAFLLLRPDNLCLRRGLGADVEGACYAAEVDIEGFFDPGSQADLEIVTGEGEVTRGVSEIPGNMELIRPEARGRCALAPGDTLLFEWNRSPGVWAYSAETEVMDLKDALAAEGIVVETDSVALRGLAVSDADTTVAFPQEFGILERFDLEQEVALALQRGLPRGATANVVIAAVDRNYVNWVRGGNFNPSGFVRVSSLQGEAVGVFGSMVRRNIEVKGGAPGDFPGESISNCVPGG